MKDLLPATQQSLWHLKANDVSSGMRLNKEAFLSKGIVPVYSEQYDPSRHRSSQIDYNSAKSWATGVPHVTHKFGLVPLKVEVASIKISNNDIDPISHEKQRAVDVATDLIEASLPGMGDHVVRAGVVSFGEVLQSSDNDADLRIIIGDFANIGAGVERPAFDTIPTVLVKVNHQVEREVAAGQGTLVLDGVNAIDTDSPRELENYNRILDTQHYMTIARLGRLGFVAASVTINPATRHEYEGARGLSVAELDGNLAKALQLVSQTQM